MRGRLRCIFDADQLVSAEKSKNEGGSTEGGVVMDYGLPDGHEIPTYEGNFLSFVLYSLACVCSCDFRRYICVDVACKNYNNSILFMASLCLSLCRYGISFAIINFVVICLIVGNFFFFVQRLVLTLRLDFIIVENSIRTLLHILVGRQHILICALCKT